MTKIRILNLLDDFSMGGVTNGLKVFDHPVLASLAETQTVSINPNAFFAPHFSADIIINHCPPRWRGLAFLAALRLRNPKAHIIHVEHSYSREWEAIAVPNKRRFHLLLNQAFRFVDKVIAVSEAQAAWLLEARAVEPSRLSVIYPYSRDQGLGAVPALELKPNEPLVIGSYGRFCDAKGYQRLIQAFKQIDPIHNMQLVLGGAGALEPTLLQMAKDCDQISFVGKVTDTAAFMRGIHIFAAPSLFETFGQVASEAREAGRPILVSTAGGLPEQATGAGIIVDCSDAAALVSSLKALRSMPLHAMGEAGRKRVQRCIENRIAAWQQTIMDAALSRAARFR